ncbi:MAG: hypothetical protein JRI44_14020 [Deltaproteobacteria bacterium]|nr:hypothetical protein [Deltaproteobacteria bacterium]
MFRKIISIYLGIILFCPFVAFGVEDKDLKAKQDIQQEEPINLQLKTEWSEITKIESCRLLEIDSNWFIKLTGDTVIYVPKMEKDIKIIICYKNKWFFLDELIEKAGYDPKTMMPIKSKPEKIIYESF